MAWISHGKKDLGMKRTAAGDLGDGPPWEAEGGFGGPQAIPSATLWCHAAPHHLSTLAGRDNIYRLGYGFYGSCTFHTLNLIFPLISTMEQEVCSEEKEA